MKFGGDFRVSLQGNPWPQTARNLGLDESALADRVGKLAGVAPDAFADAVGAADIVALDRGMPGKLLDVVADRAARSRRLLGFTGSDTELPA